MIWGTVCNFHLTRVPGFNLLGLDHSVNMMFGCLFDQSTRSEVSHWSRLTSSLLGNTLFCLAFLMRSLIREIRYTFTHFESLSVTGTAGAQHVLLLFSSKVRQRPIDSPASEVQKFLCTTRALFRALPLQTGKPSL